MSQFFKYLDIFGIVETWENEGSKNVIVPVFKAHSLPNNKIERRDRPFGSLMALIHDRISRQIEKVDDNKQFYYIKVKQYKVVLYISFCNFALKGSIIYER